MDFYKKIDVALYNEPYSLLIHAFYFISWSKHT